MAEKFETGRRAFCSPNLFDTLGSSSSTVENKMVILPGA